MMRNIYFTGRTSRTVIHETFFKNIRRTVIEYPDRTSCVIVHKSDLETIYRYEKHY